MERTIQRISFFSVLVAGKRCIMSVLDGKLIEEYGITILPGTGEEKEIWMISLIGEIEGHENSGDRMKTTKYEHILPVLASVEVAEQVEGVLFLVNTVGGDVSCGLALAEFI